MKPRSSDKTASFVILHGGWRVLVAFILVVAPLYGWVMFYYLATGAWHQSPDLVKGNAPILATFFIPLMLGVWVMGFRKWHILITGMVAAIIAGLTPPQSIAGQLLPGGYINLAIVLVLLTVGLRIFHYWRDYIVHKLPIVRYTRAACAVAIATVAVLLILLLPIRI